MEGESSKPASTQTGAVFLSYASQDTEAAQRICTALRGAGIEIWFDQSELRGGDAWDQNIRHQIRDCALFMPVISARTQARSEGYFRLEWHLAEQRTHLIGRQRAFLVPLCIDDTPERNADVPDAFLAVQWTRLPGGETSAAFVERVQRLLSPARAVPAEQSLDLQAPRRRSLVLPWRAALVAIATLAIVALGYLVLERAVRPKAGVQAATTNSIAVLPLANESGEPSQQYFSDGISEDLITALSQFPGLKVIGRTSSFQFRNSKDDSKTIGAKLGVAHLLEGSVRHAGDLVRVSAELINTTDGSTVWSERYDRPYKDLFALQDDITRAVAGALKTRLLPSAGSTAQSLRPPSGNLDAYNALLLGMYYQERLTETDYHRAIEQYTTATRLDPRYAVAWSSLSFVWRNLAYVFLTGEPAKEAYAQARSAADTALALAPDLAAAHVARGGLLRDVDFDWSGAEREYRRAEELAPNDSNVRFALGFLLAIRGQLEPAIALMQQALKADPLHAISYYWLGTYLAALDRLTEAEAAIRKAIELQPQAAAFRAELATLAVRRGDAQAALAAAREEPLASNREIALALARQIGSDRSVADAALQSLITGYAASQPYAIAEVYALRNEPDKTFEWLERAWTARDTGIQGLLYDPFILRYKDDPRFAAFCKKVGLPTPAEVGKRA